MVSMYYVGNIPCTPYDIQHHGIKGQKWGVRRWQNKDGTFNEAGKQRYFDSNGQLNREGRLKYRQTSDGGYKKRGFLSKAYAKGQDRMYTKEGKERGLLGAAARDIGIAVGKNAALGILGGAAVVGATLLTATNPAVGASLAVGSAVATKILQTKVTLEGYASLVGSTKVYSDRNDVPNKVKKKLNS